MLKKDVPQIAKTTGEGIEELLEEIKRQIRGVQRKLRVMIPYAQSALLSTLHDGGRVMEEEYMAEGTRVKAMLDDMTKAMLIRKLGVDAVQAVE